MQRLADIHCRKYPVPVILALLLAWPIVSSAQPDSVKLINNINRLIGEDSSEITYKSISIDSFSQENQNAMISKYIELSNILQLIEQGNIKKVQSDTSGLVKISKDKGKYFYNFRMNSSVNFAKYEKVTKKKIGELFPNFEKIRESNALEIFTIKGENPKGGIVLPGLISNSPSPPSDGLSDEEKYYERLAFEYELVIIRTLTYKVTCEPRAYSFYLERERERNLTWKKKAEARSRFISYINTELCKNR